jgi:5-methyltetrahydrofolate--homocysteine methyltransferase
VDAMANEQGFKVMRFTNDEVLNKTEETINQILSKLKELPGIKEALDLSSPFGGQGASSGLGSDFLGAFAVSIHGIESHIKKFEAELDDYNKIILQALADRLAEAFAELLHTKTRKEFWGYAKDEHLTTEELIEERYLGIRPAPGYPACPDHTEKYKLFELLNATENAGITLTESLAMYPASSVCGWYFANPESKYFGVGKISEDQLKDYAERKRMDIEEARKWLRPVLE